MRTAPLIYATFVLCMLPFATSAQDEALINYQGKLISGTNLVSGQVTVVFRVFTNGVGGDFVYEETNQVMVVDGYYSVLLGENPSHGEMEDAAKEENAYMELTVEGSTLHPRERFTPPPFANQAPKVWRAFGSIIGIDDQDYSERDMIGLLRNVQYVTEFTALFGEPVHMIHSIAAFPPPLKKRRVVNARLIVGGTNQVSADFVHSPTITLEVANFHGPPTRVISSPIDAIGLVENEWSSFTLIGTKQDRTIKPNEILVIHYDAQTTNVIGSQWLNDLMFQIKVK